MKEFIDKLIERLEEERNRANRHYNYGDETAYRHSIEIVNQLAEEYKDKEVLDMVQMSADYCKSSLEKLERIANNISQKENNMYYLLRTVTVTTCCERETEMEIFAKSISKEKLQEEIKRLFDEAVENMNEDTYINNCSMEDFEDCNGYFNESKLSIHIIFPTPSLDSEEINYAIVNDEQVREI